MRAPECSLGQRKTLRQFGFDFPFHRFFSGAKQETFPSES
jgi:hypothetical protein